MDPSSPTLGMPLHKQIEEALIENAKLYKLVEQYSKEQLEEFLADEEKRLEQVTEDDILLKKLLEVRVKMYQNLLNELESKETI